MAIELELEDESKDISPDDVKNFLETEASDAAPAADAEEIKPVTPASKDNNTVSYNFQSDTTFAETPVADQMQQIAVKVNEYDIPVTEADQRMYLKAILNDAPVELTIPVLKGALNVTCRALSVAESETIITTALKYFKDNPELNSMLMTDYIRQLRTIFQVVRIIGKPAFPHLDLNQDTFASEVCTTRTNDPAVNSRMLYRLSY